MRMGESKKRLFATNHRDRLIDLLFVSMHENYFTPLVMHVMT